jgi:hypothetical protein
MASSELDQSRSDGSGVGAVGTEAGGDGTLPAAVHGQMSIGQASGSTSGQPIQADGATMVDADPTETQEWLDSLRYVLESRGADRASYLLHAIEQEAYRLGVQIPFVVTTPYINTIPTDRQAPFPGHRDLERRIKSIIRWPGTALRQHQKRTSRRARA